MENVLYNAKMTDFNLFQNITFELYSIHGSSLKRTNKTETKNGIYSIGSERNL